MSTRRSDNSKNTKPQIKTKSSTTTTKVEKEEVVPPSTKYDRIAEMKEVFKIFDKDNDGFITNEEVGGLLRSLGRNPTEEEIQKLIKETDKNGNGKIEIDEFIAFMEGTYVVSQDRVEDVVAAFKIFDLDNNGWISCEEFKKILMKFGGEFTDEEVEHIFRESDLNNDGKLAYAEFVDLWKFQ